MTKDSRQGSESRCKLISGIEKSGQTRYNIVMENNNLTIFSFTEAGAELTARLIRLFGSSEWLVEGYTVSRFAKDSRLKALPENWQEQIGAVWGKTAYLFIGAAGIAVRAIAPYVADKYTDSAVLVMDEKARHVIPLLSGHVGGGVPLAEKISNVTGAEVVLTTATDVQEKFAVDVFARRHKLAIGSRRLAKEISAAILEGKQVGFFSIYPVMELLPAELVQCKNIEELLRYPYGIAVADHAAVAQESNVLYLTPRISAKLVVGIGCRRGTPAEVIKNGLEQILNRHGMLKEQLTAIVSIDLKQDEEGLIELAEACQLPFITYSAEKLRQVPAVTAGSAFVEQTTGVDNVCERAALCYLPEGCLIQPKIVVNGVTFALVEEKRHLK